MHTTPLTAHGVWTLAAAPGPSAGADQSFGLWPLFVQSFDVFTVVLVLGSIAAGTLIVRCAMTIRASAIHPGGVGDRAAELAAKAKDDDLRELIGAPESTPSGGVGPVMHAAVRAALDARRDDAAAVREAAELAASAACARWYRLIDPLNVIGNLGPLVGLAGTVWGMIIAFTQLAAVGGEAGPELLSAGISKALFHTLLGLLLAIPCLLAHGLWRGVIDRHCTDAMVDAGRVVDALAARASQKDASA